MYQAPRGTQDVLPEASSYWAYVEQEARGQALLGNYAEIRTPTFEATAVFQRTVGEGTDIVEKEMYTFLDKGGDSMTLRPEGTAAVVRAYLQHGMKQRPQPVKLYSLISTYRYDRPQKGRYRQFHQFNVEAIGEDDPMLDAEVAALHWRFCTALGLSGLSLQVNSMGDPVCRPRYLDGLRAYLRAHAAELCDDCRRRTEANPLRVLDCKNPPCQLVVQGAPRSADFLCAPCRAHFEQWQRYLRVVGIEPVLNARLVRGMDYYTRSVWEVWPPVHGSQSALGGGGRYDGLAEQLGGPPTPGVGFAAGIERLILALQEQRVAVPPAPAPRVFLAYQRVEDKEHIFHLAETLRAGGVSVDLAFGERKLGKQLAAADRSGAQLALILGEREIAAGTVTVKELRDGREQRTVPEAELADLLAAGGGVR